MCCPCPHSALFKVDQDYAWLDVCTTIFSSVFHFPKLCPVSLFSSEADCPQMYVISVFYIMAEQQAHSFAQEQRQRAMLGLLVKVGVASLSRSKYVIE